ncbi:rubrerythrin [Lichenicola cladoniae]|uniref:Rubrerythrin n=1 Tax=Lichenicola cladoniae TaxID=1484109 RepID=A0A6M8HVP3_9PROT|nr:ferritin family protein [Lichenicola cladoniae]NPD69400.1 rubrerythrin [Acetobacteraceae bacterium]QKE92217.1 rubrerythrin [Lichenicola cladoniae]
MRKFDDLTEGEILALAIASEEEDGRVYADFSHQLRANYPDSAGIFTEMAVEEQQHRQRLIDLYASRFGDHIPMVRRQDVAGFVQRRAPWQVQRQGIEAMRRHARQMELDAARFYRQAAGRSSDPAIRKLLGDLAMAEDAHEQAAGAIELKRLPASKREIEDDDARRRFVLQVVQPGLVGLMDGSVSTLAPVFAAAFATHLPWNAFLVGIAASVGAGISMGFAEALSDDGKLSGRGAPLLRGVICGLMTTLGGIGHTLPFLISNFNDALAVAGVVVVVELAIISWIRWRYQDTPFLSAAIQILFGGGLVFAAGVLIGSA